MRTGSLFRLTLQIVIGGNIWWGRESNSYSRWKKRDVFTRREWTMVGNLVHPQEAKAASARFQTMAMKDRMRLMVQWTRGPGDRAPQVVDTKHLRIVNV